MTSLAVPKKITKSRSFRISGNSTDPVNTFEHFRAILSVPRKQRTIHQLQQLVTLTNNVKVFSEINQELSTEAHQQCCQCLTYGHYPAGKVYVTQFVFNEGERAADFFLILRGSVGVLVNEERLDGRVEMKLLSVLRQGECFGELALISNQPRLATILCREDSHFAILNRDDYTRILAKAHERVIHQKIDILTRQPIFKKLSKGALTRASYFFKVKKFKRKQIVFTAGDLATELFIVKEGEFQLSTTIGIEPATIASPRLSRSFHCSIDVTLLSVGELIGSSELLSSKPFAYTCLCYSTTGDLMSIAKKDFMQVLGNEDMIAYLSGLNEKKEEYWRRRVETATQVEKDKRTPLKALVKLPSTPKILLHSRTCRESSLPPPSKSMLSPPNHSRTYSNLLQPSDTRHKRDSITSANIDPSEKEPLKPVNQKSWSEVFCSKYALKAKPAKAASKARTIVNFHTFSLKALKLKQFQKFLQGNSTSGRMALSDSLRVRLTDLSHSDLKSFL